MSAKQAVYFLPASNEGESHDPELVMLALQGVCLALDSIEFGDLTDLDTDLARASGLCSAAAILSQELCSRITGSESVGDDESDEPQGEPGGIEE